MTARSLPLLFLCLLSTAPGAFAAPRQENAMAERFVVVEHMSGKLAIAPSEIRLAWRREAADGSPSSVRLVSPALGDAKVLEGDAADGLWTELTAGAGAGRFVLVSHQGGTLAIPRHEIRSAYLSNDGGARLRLVYEGDPSGKVVEGEEAERVWKALTD